MSQFTHASIIPLIGGETIGAHRAHERPPEYFLSYSPFMNNDKHIVNYYENQIPYLLLDQGQKHPSPVDVVHSVCPCAGLSQLSHGFGDHNPNNRWMGETATYVLNEMKPQVFWGENAPGFAGKIGENVRNQLKKIGKDAGYTMSVYRTKTFLHGGPQIRERSFYFFWKGDKTPLLKYYNRPHQKIEDVILSVKSNFQTNPINEKKPTDDIYYRFILEHIHGGMSHREFFETADPLKVRNGDTFSYIERMGYNYLQVGEWMKDQGLEREAEKCVRRHEKLAAGGNIMRHGTIVPKDYIGAFVGHYPTMLAHPHEDRYINYREAMSIMGLPEDFELVGANKNNANHICQNVPVQTATDMATEVVEYLRGNRQTVNSDYVVQYNHSQKEEYTEISKTLEEFL
jgi:site-specific DNA-cytosine methylase